METLRSGTVAPVLSVLVPVYNERGTLPALLESLVRVRFPVAREIVVVDDGSSDGTRELLQALPPMTGLRLLLAPRHAGKGAAVRLGLEHAAGEWIAIQDADLELDPGDLPRLLEAALARPGAAVLGSRFLGRAPRPASPAYWGNRALTALANRLFGARLTDLLTGHRLARADLLRSLALEARGFDLESELTAKLLRRGVEIVELPVAYRPRSVAQGKKLRWRDGLAALASLLRVRLAPAAATPAPGPRVTPSVAG